MGKTVENRPGHDFRMNRRLAVETGLRVSELASLQARHFELGGDDPSVTVEAAYSKRRRRDVIPIRWDTAKLLVAFLEGRKGLVFSLPPRTSDMIRADLDKAEIPTRDAAGRFFDFHALRHTFITNAGYVARSFEDLQELARHSSPC